MRLGIPAAIFVPRITSAAKIERIRGYGAELFVAGERYADALASSEEFAARTGALPIHAYDQPETMIGQGTVGIELEDRIVHHRVHQAAESRLAVAQALGN